MHILLAAVDNQGYKEIEPFVKRLIELDELEVARRNNQLPEGQTIKTHELVREQRTLNSRIVGIGVRVAKQKASLLESNLEAAAYDGLVNTLEDVRPDAEQLLFELTDYLIPAKRLAELYPQLLGILQEVNIDDVVRNKVEFEDIHPGVYFRTLDKVKRIMEYCVQHGYALLGIVSGEV